MANSPLMYRDRKLRALPDSKVGGQRILRFPAEPRKQSVGKYFSIIVRGNSLRCEDIFEGDELSFQKTDIARHNAIMLVEFKGRLLIKRIAVKRGMLCWRSVNGKQVEAPAEACEVIGEMIYVLRKETGKRYW